MDCKTELLSFISSIIFSFSPPSLLQKVKSAFASLWYTLLIHFPMNSVLQSIISCFSSPFSYINASSLSCFSFPSNMFISFHNAAGFFSISFIFITSQSLFLFPVIMCVTAFCVRYFSSHSSIFPWFPSFLAYLHSLLNFDLRLTFSFNSLSTQGAALVVCHFLPGLSNLVLFIVCFTAVFIFSIQCLKPCLLPILALTFFTHIAMFVGCLLIQVNLFLGFFFPPL